MATHIQMTHDTNFLRVTLTGDETLEGNKHVTEVVTKECAANGFTRVLADVTGVAPHIEVMDDFRFAEFLAEGAFLSTIRLAIVYSVERSESAPFFETVCQNRGVNVRAFPSEEAALEWIMK